MKKIVNLLAQIRSDRYMHCAVSAALACILNLTCPVSLTVSTVLFIGILKELMDINGSGFDWKDILADCVGIAIGVL